MITWACGQWQSQHAALQYLCHLVASCCFCDLAQLIQVRLDRQQSLTSSAYTLTNTMHANLSKYKASWLRLKGCMQQNWHLQYNSMQAIPLVTAARVTNWVNWACSPMRLGIYVLPMVDVTPSQWERDQRIKLRLSWATLHFTDRWAASQPLPQGEKLTYLAWMCVSIWVGVHARIHLSLSISGSPWYCFLAFHMCE